MNVNDAEVTLIDMSLPFQPVGTWTHAGVVAVPGWARQHPRRRADELQPCLP